MKLSFNKLPLKKDKFPFQYVFTANIKGVIHQRSYRISFLLKVAFSSFIRLKLSPSPIKYTCPFIQKWTKPISFPHPWSVDPVVGFSVFCLFVCFGNWLFWVYVVFRYSSILVPIHLFSMLRIKFQCLSSLQSISPFCSLLAFGLFPGCLFSVCLLLQQT